MQELVKRFHREFGLLINEKPTIPSEKEIVTSINLITEEYHELLRDIGYRSNTLDLIELSDDLCDLLYVIFGMAIRFGINLEPLFIAVHESNMTKVGGHFNDWGKFIKPDTYIPVNLEPLLIEQGWEK